MRCLKTLAAVDISFSMCNSSAAHRHQKPQTRKDGRTRRELHWPCLFPPSFLPCRSILCSRLPVTSVTKRHTPNQNPSCLFSPRYRERSACLEQSKSCRQRNESTTSPHLACLVASYLHVCFVWKEGRKEGFGAFICVFRCMNTLKVKFFAWLSLPFSPARCFFCLDKLEKGMT